MSSLDLQLLFALCTVAACPRCPTPVTLHAETLSSFRLSILPPCLLPLPLVTIPHQQQVHQQHVELLLEGIFYNKQQDNTMFEFVKKELGSVVRPRPPRVLYKLFRKG